MNADWEHESAEDQLDRRMKAVQPPDPPQDLVSRCLGTIASARDARKATMGQEVSCDDIKLCPADVRRPAWRRDVKWTISAVPLAAGVLLALFCVWGSQGEQNLLAAVFQALDRAPAYHMRVTIQSSSMIDLDGGSVTEMWLVRGVGRRTETRSHDEVTAVLVDNLRWKLEWNVHGRRVSAWPSEMTDSKADLPFDWVLKSREEMIRWGEKYKAKLVPEKDRLDGREVDKITVTRTEEPVTTRQIVWFDQKSGRPLKLCYERLDGLQKAEAVIDYPSPDALPRERFTFQVPRDAAVEVFDPQFGRQLSSEGQTGPDLRP